MALANAQDLKAELEVFGFPCEDEIIDKSKYFA